MATAYRTTAPARSTCRCPLCSGSTIGADGVYHCRAGVRVEYLVFVAGEFQRAYKTFLAAETELNKGRRDALTAPVELAAAEADLDAEAAEYVAGQCDDCGAPVETECSGCQLAVCSACAKARAAQAYPCGCFYLPCEAGCGSDRAHCRCGELTAEMEDDVSAYVEAFGSFTTPEILPFIPETCPCGARRVAAQAQVEPLPFTPDHSPLDPRPTPPAISYSAAWGGFSWVGAPIVDGRPATYPTYTAAATARDALLTQARIKAAYPKDARAVTVQLAERGLLAA